MSDSLFGQVECQLDEEQEMLCKRKETRWERLSKLYGNSNVEGNGFSMQTETVRRFLSMDFVDQHQQQQLIAGEMRTTHVTLSNPQLVMDLRHEMFQQLPRALPLATVVAAQSNQLEKCIEHNLDVEQRCIAMQLAKLQLQLDNEHKRHELKLQDALQKSQSCQSAYKANGADDEVAYDASIVAIDAVRTICRNALNGKSNKNAERNVLKNNSNSSGGGSCSGSSPVVRENCEQIMKNGNVRQSSNSSSFSDGTKKGAQNDGELPTQKQQLCVRFEPQVQVVKFERESSSCSNASSEGINSIVSDIADEVLQELDKEEAKLPADVHAAKLPEKAKELAEDLKHLCLKQRVDAEEAIEELETDSVERHTDTERMKRENNNDVQQSLNTEETANTSQAKSELEPQTTFEKRIDNKELLEEHKVEKNNVEPLLTITKLNVPKYTKETIPIRQQSYSDEEDTNASASTTTSNASEQTRIVKELFQTRAKANDRRTLHKYFLMWLHYTTISKIEQQNLNMRDDRAHKINAFLDQVRREKHRLAHCHGRADRQTDEQTAEAGTASELRQKKQKAVETSQLTKKYQKKMKIQQDIIDLQRLKLERQERMIMQLKLHKISEEARATREEIKAELKTFIRQGDAKLKAKAKCLQLIGGLKDEADEDEFARLRGIALQTPKFLQNMQERALERSVKHDQVRQRRLQLEAEREAQKLAAEDAKRQQDEQAKRQRIEMLREKRRQEKLAKIQKERERLRLQENNRKALEFNRRRLLRRIGMEGFKRLLQRKRDNRQKCETLRRKICQRSCFLAWHSYYVLMRERKLLRANDLYYKQMKRNTLRVWLQYMQDQRSKWHVAIDWYELRLSERVFQRWLLHTQQERAIEQAKMQQAAAHHAWNLKWKVIGCWQRLSQVLQLERETEERRLRWRMKIWELLPDYKPNRNEQ